MPRINREEYEVLKELKEKGYLLIARMKEGHLIRFREHRGKSEQRWLVTTNKEDSKYGSFHNPNDLFQFIQWEDGKPYNIQELIEEYEIENGMRYDFGKIKLVDIDTSKIATHNGDFYVKESEETEVSKQKLIDKWEEE